jgi:hypothetical protein
MRCDFISQMHMQLAKKHLDDGEIGARSVLLLVLLLHGPVTSESENNGDGRSAVLIVVVVFNVVMVSSSSIAAAATTTTNNNNNNNNTATTTTTITCPRHVAEWLQVLPAEPVAVAVTASTFQMCKFGRVMLSKSCTQSRVVFPKLRIAAQALPAGRVP